MKPNLYNLIPALEGEELVYLQNLTSDLSPERLQNFIAVYNGKEEKPIRYYLAVYLALYW